MQILFVESYFLSSTLLLNRYALSNLFEIGTIFEPLCILRILAHLHYIFDIAMTPLILRNQHECIWLTLKQARRDISQKVFEVALLSDVRMLHAMISGGTVV